MDVPFRGQTLQSSVRRRVGDWPSSSQLEVSLVFPPFRQTKLIFWNGTTTDYLMGWQSDEEIRQIIDRLSELEINRIRVLLDGRNEDRPWSQPIRSTEEFKFYLGGSLSYRARWFNPRSGEWTKWDVDGVRPEWRLD